MKQIDFIRNKKVEEYVLISQLLFSLLTGILVVRVWHSSSWTFYSLYQNVVLIVFPLVGLLLYKGFEKKYYIQGRRLDCLINFTYLIIVIFLLTFEKESFFKFLLLMPVIVSSLQYGAKDGYLWACIVTVGILVSAFVKQSAQMDVDILVIGVTWLFAWLLGRMSGTEKEIREELQRQAAQDGLTGVYNHRSFYYYLDEFFIKAKLGNSNLSLIMIDLDFFKYYNDAYGHQKGDEVLAYLAKIMEDTVGICGVCFRYGGDEFAVLVPDADGKEGLEIAEKIREKVEETEFEGANILPKGRLTISLGVASFPENADTKEHLISRADEALYKAKFTNSDKVELYYSVFDEIGHSLQDKEKDLLNSMRTLMMVVNAKDRYTYGHCERVMHYALQIGRKLALWEWEIQILTIGALLHDIGKIEISREILNKEGKLTAEEWEIMRHHSIWGADMLRPISAFSGAVDIVLYHHENYDGSGYPSGLAGDKIPLGARILRVADSFDAMISNRPYKKSLTIAEALKDLQDFCGVYYDPEILDVFVNYIIETGIVPADSPRAS